MATTTDGAVYYEAGEQSHPFEAMTTSDNTTFAASFSPFSGRSGFEQKVKPYGVATGGVGIPAISGTVDLIDVSALGAIMAGNAGANSDGEVTVAAGTDISITRGATLDYLTNSLTVTAAGAFAIVAGTEGAAVSEVRDAAGGPPLIPVGSIEVRQIRVTSQVAAAITADEILGIPGTHQERFDFPIFKTDSALGEVTFSSALPAIHTGVLPKMVYVSGYTPSFAELSRAKDFVLAGTSHSGTSTDYYDGPLGSVASTVGQGSFVAALGDGITDPIVLLANEKIWIKWFQDRNKSPYQLMMGTLGVTVANSVGDHPIGSFTLTVEKAGGNFAA